MDDIIASIPPHESCPIFLPFLMASNVHPGAKACFIGMDSYHTRAHLMRSVYEGVAFSHRYHLEKLLASREQEPKSIRLAGGVAHSEVWTQIFADVMKYPIELVDCRETGAFGSAMAAAVATGAYENLVQAAEHMVRVSSTVKPNREHASAYDKKYKVYRGILEALDPIWDDFHDIFSDGKH
jgi:L-xylulokinase